MKNLQEEQEVRVKIKTIHIQALLKSARILEIILEIYEDLELLQWKPSVKAGAKNEKEKKILSQM